MTNRGIIAVVGSAGVLALVTWWAWPRGEQQGAAGGRDAAAHGDGGSAGGGGGAGAGARDAGAGGPLTEATRLTPEQRRLLGAQIAAARGRAMQAARADAGTDAVLDPVDVVIPLERVQGSLKTALDDTVSILADCYTKQPGGAGRRDAIVLMRMTSDPDFGTVIDTDEITDGEGAKLDPALDECLRDSIDTLALPPLGEGGKLDLQYTFQFDEDEGQGPDAG